MPKLVCVAAILQNSQGQVLLHQRDEKPGLVFAGYWTMLGGKVEPGETPETAMHRELLEEIGVDVPVTLWKLYERFISDELTIVQHIFIGQIDYGLSEMVLTEGQDLNYFGADSLSALPIAFGFDVLLTEYFAEKLHTTLE
jgi:8-oxo-dGTP diphosphatase